MKRTTFSRTKATPMEAIASENGRRLRIGWNAMRSTTSATTLASDGVNQSVRARIPASRDGARQYMRHCGPHRCACN